MEGIKKAHLLLAMFNAWQPGVFALSGWDLCGALTLDPTDVAELIVDGDTRWIHRGSYDLMGHRPAGTESLSSLPRARDLYGPLPDQLADPSSFVSQLRNVLAVRRRCGIASARQRDVADTSDTRALAMIHQLADGRTQATVLNFSAAPITAYVSSEFLPPGTLSRDVRTGEVLGRVSRQHSIPVDLLPYQGQFVLLDR